MEDIKKIINKLIISILLSLILFSTFNLGMDMYYILLIATWVLVLINYKIRKNLDFFDSMVIILLGNLMSYFIYNGFPDEYIYLMATNFYLIFLLIVSLCSFFSYLLRKKDPKSDSNLMPRRERNLEALSDYIDRFRIIGLNGRWGMGKTFLINRWKEINGDRYEVIEIDILSCNLNELQLILIKELDKVMSRNRIISRHSDTLRSFLSDKTILFRFKNLVFNTESTYSETIRGFKNELNKVDKKIVIIYEDIDRIKDVDIIKNIFAISEKLSSERIKIVYQYFEGNLSDMGFNFEYLEKYIPFKINLTELKFFEVLNFLFREDYLNKDVLTNEDFSYLRKHRQAYRYNVLQKEFGIDREIHLVLSNISIRKVKNFLNELEYALTRKQYGDYKEVVIGFFLIKHFIPEIYKMLNIDQGLLETIKFKMDSKLYTMEDLIRKYKFGEVSRHTISKVFDIEENKMAYCILKLFDYRNNLVEDVDNYEERAKFIMEEPINSLRDRNSNDKKDRLIWNLVGSDKSEYTDYEYVGKRFIKEVLDMPRDEWLSAYNKFNHDLFYSEGKESDNGTIFLMGIPQFVQLFKAFRILDVTDDHQLALVDIYFQINNVEDITQEFIQTINYCDLKTKREYIHILKKFNRLNIIGNLNSEECFAVFYKKYLNGLSKFLYMDTYRYHSIGSSSNAENFETYKAVILDDLGSILGEMQDLKKRIAFLEFDELDMELDIIVKFIGKLVDIINHEAKAPKRGYGMTTVKSSSRFVNQEEFDRLKELEVKDDDLYREIRKSYTEGKISAYEIARFLDELEGSGEEIM